MVKQDITVISHFWIFREGVSDSHMIVPFRAHKDFIWYPENVECAFYFEYVRADCV